METFLFTDIEGSTRLWSRAPVAMATAVHRQESLLHETIAQHRGEVFKTVGDGVYAVFTAAGDAVEAAVAAQRVLLAEEWREFEPGGGLAVRIALHSGPAEARDGDYFGPTLNRLSRTLAAGHGGQILCTDDTLAACGENWPTGIDLRDLGERTLRDVPGSGRIFQLLAEGLPEHFPPLSTLDPRVHNLPRWPTPSIGREDEGARLRSLLRSHDARLVTLLGTGGVGKTRLATEVAAQLLDEFQDGIRFVDLSALREDAQVLPAIVQVTGAADQLLDPRDALLDWLHNRTLLLVLDNCEQVVAGWLQLSATSSTPPRGRHAGDQPRADSHSWRAAAHPRSPFHRNGAVRGQPVRSPLRRTSARGLRTFHPRSGIDRRGRGNLPPRRRAPLAIELAAAWVRVLSPAALHRRLQDNRTMLRDGARDLPDRQRTLAATIAWSYNLLLPDDQRAFRRLAVFRGGIAVDAAAAVIWDDPVDDPLWALSRLDALVQANLLQVSSDSTGEPRFVMLQTIQEFAIDILWQSGERESAASAHAEFFAGLAAEAQTHYRTGDSPRWLDLLDLNFENLRAAIEFDAATPQRNEAGLQFVVSIAGFLDHRCHQLQAREWLDLVYRDDPPYPTELRVEALWRLGNTWFTKPAVARQYYRKAIDVAEAAGNVRSRIRPVASLSVVASLNGDHATAISMAREVMAFGQENSDLQTQALGRSRVAHVASEAGWFDLSLAACNEARANYRELGDPVGEAWNWVVEGRVHRRLSHPEPALFAFDQALGRFSGIGDDEVTGVCYLERGLALLLHDLMSARIAIETAVAKLASVNDAYTMIALVEGTARLLVSERFAEVAAEFIGTARHMREQTGIVSSAADAATLQASVDSAHSMLGRTAFDVAVERGSLLSPRIALDHYWSVLV